MTFSQKIKLSLLLPYISKSDKIIDLGCGTMWLTHELVNQGYQCIGFADKYPADIVGDIKTYPFKKNSYDIVIALEMLEHVDCLSEIYQMTKPGGRLIISTPVPHLDWLCLILERLRVLQDRQTSHSNLIYLSTLPSVFQPIFLKTLAGIDQFGVFQVIKDRSIQKVSLASNIKSHSRK
jgi:2-polyprenyl-3-methyl-5-hydroxy-6-metoxy-1,4-benzoquinol methylase